MSKGLVLIGIGDAGFLRAPKGRGVDLFSLSLMKAFREAGERIACTGYKVPEFGLYDSLDAERFQQEVGVNERRH